MSVYPDQIKPSIVPNKAVQPQNTDNLLASPVVVTPEPINYNFIQQYENDQINYTFNSDYYNKIYDKYKTDGVGGFLHQGWNELVQVFDPLVKEREKGAIAEWFDKKEKARIKAENSRKLMEGEKGKFTNRINENNYSDFVDYSTGVPQPNFDAIQSLSNVYAKEAGASEKGYFRDLLYNDISTKVSQLIIKSEADPVFRKKFSAKYGMSLEDKIYSSYQTYAAAKKAELTLGNSIASEQLAADTNKKRDKEINELEVEYIAPFERNKKNLELKIAALNETYGSLIKDGKFYGTQQQFHDYRNELTLIQTDLNVLDQRTKTVNEEFLKKQNIVNRKYEIEYNTKKAEIDATTNAKYKKAVSKEYKLDPKLEKDIKNMYEESVTTALNRRSNLTSILFKTKNPIAQIAQSAVSALGAGVKTIGITKGMDWAVPLGDYYQKAYATGQGEMKSASDFLDLSKMTSSAGNVLGSTIPALAVEIPTIILTRGMGASKFMQAVFAGVVNNGMSTLQNASDSYNDMFNKTGGDAVAAANAYSQTVKGSSLSIPFNIISSLPFVGAIPGKFKNILFRAGTGATIESFGETFTENIENFVASAISKGNPWTDFYKEVTLAKIKETTYNVVPGTMLTGGVTSALSSPGNVNLTPGQVSEIAKKAGQAFALKQKFSDVLPTQRDQFIFELTQRKGSNFASSYLYSSYASGVIDEAQFNQMSQSLIASDNLIRQAKDLSLSTADQRVFFGFSTQYDKTKAQIEQEQDPLMKKALEAKLADYENQIKNFTTNKKADYVVMTYPDNEQYVLTYAEVENALSKPEFVNALAKNEISVDVFGEGEDLKNKIKTTSEAQSVAIQKDIDEKKKQAEAKRKEIEGKYNVTIEDNVGDLGVEVKAGENVTEESLEAAKQELEDAGIKVREAETQVQPTEPTVQPTEPTETTTVQPTEPTAQPTETTTVQPTEPTAQPTETTAQPTETTTVQPTETTTVQPTEPTAQPTETTTVQPTETTTVQPTEPTAQPTETTTVQPTEPTAQPTETTTVQPTATTTQPTTQPTVAEATVTIKPPKEGVKIQLPSQVKGGLPRTMIFSEGQWKQQVGDKKTTVSKDIQDQAQSQFNSIKEKAEKIKQKRQEKVSTQAQLPTVGINISNKSQLDEFEQRAKLDEPKKNILKAAQKGIKTLKSVFPDMDIYVHENADSYDQAMSSVNGVKGSLGNFAFERNAKGDISGRGRIDINLSNADDTTVAHEITHAVLLKSFGDNPATFKQFRDRISPILRSELNKELLRFESQYAGQDVAPEEYLTQLSALLSKAAETVRYKPSTLKKIAAVINEFVSKITGGKFQPFKKEADFKNFVGFLNQISKAIGEGAEINLQEKENGDAVVSGVVQLGEIKNKSDLGFKKFDIGWEVDAKSGIKLDVPQDKKALYDVVEKSGGAVVVINSDATGIGVTKDNDLLQGGIGYTFIDANVKDNIGFAASNDGKISSFYEAVSDAANKRDAESPEMKGKPVAVFVMVQTPAAMFGNAYSADYFGRVLSKITKSELFSTKEAKKELIDFIEDYKANNKTGQKYSNSLDKLSDLIKTTDFSKKESIKKLIDLLITNRTSKEDKSAKFGFDIRRSFFEKFFVGVGTVKEGAPARNLRLKLKEKGYNHEGFFKEFGDKNVMSLLEGDTPGRKLSDGNFTLTGFFVDPNLSKENYIQNSKQGTYQHKQFNSKFYGTDPFVLDGKYYVDQMFPEARFVSKKTGEEVPVQVAAAGSLYPRTQKAPKQIIERAREISEAKAQKESIKSKSQKSEDYNEIKDLVQDYVNSGYSLQEAIDAVTEDLDDSSKETISSITDAYNEITGKPTVKEELPKEEEKPTEAKAEPTKKEKSSFGEGEEGIREKKAFDKLTSTIPGSGATTQYLSGQTIEKYQGEKPKNEQEVVAVQLKEALVQGLEIISESKRLFGDNYIESLLDYVETENLPPANKALIYVSLENELAKRKLEEPSNVARIEKLQLLVNAKSQDYLRSSSIAINYGRLRKFAEIGYDITRLTHDFFSTQQLEDKRNVEAAVQATASDINDQYKEDWIKLRIEEGVSAEVEKIYQRLSASDKKIVDKRVSVLDKLKGNLLNKFSNKSKSQLSGTDIKSKSQKVGDIIENGYNSIINAIKAKIDINSAIEMGVERISNDIEKATGKKWADEAEFRKDIIEAFKQEGLIGKDISDQSKRKIEKEILELNRQIDQGFKDKINKKETINDDELNKLIEEKKSKQAILEALDPTPKMFIENALIEQGYGREINVKTKEGVEKRQILDWKKLAGEEGSIDKLRENVEKALRDKGYTEEQILRMQDAFIDEYNNLRASIIEKSLNTLGSKNKAGISPEQISAAKRLAEMYNLGLFDKNPKEYEIAMAKALGLSDVSIEAIDKAMEMGKVVSEMFNTKFEGKILTESQLRSAIQVIDENMRRILYLESMKSGNVGFKLSNITKVYMDMSQRMLLNTVKQGIENPFSGLSERFFSSIGYAGSIPKVLNKQQSKLARSIFKEISLQKGIGYGDVGSAFIAKGNVDAYINGLSDSQVVQGVLSVVTGKAILDAVDSSFKAKITQQKFTYNLIQVLKQDRVINGKLEKGMSAKDARNYVAEKLAGQSFEDAKETARNIIEKANSSAGYKVFNDSELFVDRLATDIVNAALVNGEKITEDMVTAAYNSAYKAAGRGLGHVSNNLVTEQINAQSGKIESKINEATKEKKYLQAASLNMVAILFRNFFNPFVGGGSNWTVLKAEKTGLGLLSGLGSLIYRAGEFKVDLTSETGMKNLENSLYQRMKVKDKFIRGAIGGAISSLVYLLTFGGDEDDRKKEKYKKWMEKNAWAKKYSNITTPELTLYAMALSSDKEFKKYLESTFNDNKSFDKGELLKAAAVAVVTAEEGEGAGKVGELIGGTVGVPIPWRLARDAGQIYLGATGGVPYKIDYSYKPETFAQGFFRGGLVDWLGYAPKPEGETIEQLSKKEEGLKILTDNGLKLPDLPTIKNIEIDEDAAHPDGKMTKEEGKMYHKYWKEGLVIALNTAVEQAKEREKELNADNVKDARKKAITKATEYAHDMMIQNKIYTRKELGEEKTPERERTEDQIDIWMDKGLNKKRTESRNN